MAPLGRATLTLLSDNQYRRQFKIWGFKRERVAEQVESETSLGLDQTDEGESKDTAKGPEYTGVTRRDAQNKRQREERREQREQTKQLKEMAKKGVPLPTPDPDEIERIEARNEERRVRRMKLLQKMGQLSNLDHDEIEQRNEDGEENTSTRNEAREDQGIDDQEDLSEHGGSYDLSKLLQGTSDYISPNSAIAMEEDKTVELPENRSEHTTTQKPTTPVEASARGKSQILGHLTPIAALNRGDVLGPSYMFSDEEDEAAPIVP